MPIALVTGGSRGIGAATAILAAKSGYDICINYVANADRAAQTVFHRSAHRPLLCL